MTELLIVDDEMESRRAVCSLIAQSQYGHLNIVEAESGQKGLHLLKQQQPKILLFDLSLPDMDGVKFGKTALQLFPKLKTVVLTQLKMFELVQTCINLGFAGYLLKPVNRSELLGVMDRLFVQDLRGETGPVVRSPAPPPKDFQTDLGRPIETVIRYIHLHFHEPITLKEVADIVYLNSSYFCRLFKAETGMTFVEYLTRYRLEKSKTLLKMTSLPMEIIANNAGFASAGYFSTLFKRFEGMTPSEYRERFSQFTK